MNNDSSNQSPNIIKSNDSNPKNYWSTSSMKNLVAITKIKIEEMNYNINRV